MNLSIFSPVKRIKKPRREKDRFDRYVNVIESFAPREHRPEREIFYYNYKMIASYGSAFLVLLETLSHFKQFKRDPKNHARDLFKKFKRFYDPKNTLFLKEAALNRKLIICFENLFTIFYVFDREYILEAGAKHAAYFPWFYFGFGFAIFVLALLGLLLKNDRQSHFKFMEVFT